MNIFVISSDVVECAKCLDDLRLNKMIIETAQMLSTTSHIRPDLIIPQDSLIIYKETHKNHPCNIWVRANNENLNWTVELLRAYCFERTRRTGKQHKTETILQNLYIYNNTNIQPDYFYNASLYKELPVFEAYKNTLNYKWKNDIKSPKWTNCDRPDWANF